MTDKLTSTHARKLRKKTEELIHAKGEQKQAEMSPDELQKILHELHVHQIELEMQNDELRRTQHELEVSHVRYSSLYNLAPVGYVTICEKGIILEANFTVASLLGVAPGALLRKSLSCFIFPEDKDIFLQQRKQLFKAGELQSWEMRMISADGSSFPAYLQAIPAQNGEYWIALYDVSKRKQLEEELKNSITQQKQAERLLLARLNISDYVVGHSLDELLTKVLDEAEALTDSRIGFFHFVGSDQTTLYLQTWSSNTMLTYCKAEGCGQHYQLDQAGVWADCIREKKAIIHNNYESLPNRKGLPPGHAPLQRELVVPIFRNKQIVAVLGVGNKKVDYAVSEVATLQHLANLAWDIITRKKVEDALQESEIRFRSIMELAPNIAVQGYSIDGTTTYWNRASERFYGYSREEAIGKNLLELIIPPEMREQVQQAIRGMVETGQTITTGEVELMRKDGSLIPVYSSHALLAPSAREMEIFCIDIDLTERKQAEEALKQKQQQLETLNQSLESRIDSALTEMREKDDMLIQQGRLAAMGEMINNIAHQWRQPLNNLGLLVQNIKLMSEMGMLTPEDVDTDVSRAMDVILHMSKTIDDFRNFFKYEKEQSLFNVNEIVSTAMNFVTPALKSNGITVEWDEQPDVTATGFPNEYLQAVLNIINNAKDALLEHKAAEPLISIRIYHEKEHSVVTIRDNGGGIKKNILQKIFDPYFSTKGHGQGTGLGLYMSKAIIEKNMGGRLSARNVNGGAEFRIEV